MSASLPCPACAHPLTDITDSRPRGSHGEVSVYRRRKCRQCGNRFTTIENVRYIADRDDWPLIERIFGLPESVRDALGQLVSALGESK